MSDDKLRKRLLNEVKKYADKSPGEDVKDTKHLKNKAKVRPIRSCKLSLKSFFSFQIERT